MLYLGMLFSMFCWHVEDNYMYSVSYLHEGAPKTWYGVPPADAHAFEEVHAKQAFAKEVHNDPTMVLKKNSMIPPSMLVDAGVRVVHAVQRPGQFIVTLPQGYHTGFSHGHNVAATRVDDQQTIGLPLIGPDHAADDLQLVELADGPPGSAHRQAVRDLEGGRIAKRQRIAAVAHHQRIAAARQPPAAPTFYDDSDSEPDISKATPASRPPPASAAGAENGNSVSSAAKAAIQAAMLAAQQAEEDDDEEKTEEEVEDPLVPIPQVNLSRLQVVEV